MHKTLSIRANWIWTGDGLPLANGCITLQDDRIVSISTESPMTAIDIGPYCILPGLINSHTHLEFNDLKQPVSVGNSFADWILKVVKHRQAIALQRAPSKKLPEMDGLIESLSHGVRLVLDVVHTGGGTQSTINKILVRTSFVKDVLDSIPIPTTMRFAELMATTSLRAKQTWRAALSLRKSDVRRSCNSLGLSPHAPYTTTAGLIRRAVAKCGQWNAPIMMHLAESLDEIRWIKNGDGPLQELLETVAGPDVLSTRYRLSLAEYVHELCKAPIALIVHGNYLDDSSLAILESNRNRAVVVYCPRTHAHFGHSTYPLMQLRRRGIRVLLGTDSRASNPDLSIFDEARAVRRIFHDLSASEILAMITTRPAEFLERADDWGTMRPGCLGQLTAVPCLAKQSGHVLEELLESSDRAKALEAILVMLDR